MPEEAAEAVRALDIKIYTIGVGGKGPASFRVNTPFGQRLVHQQVDLDEATLKKVAGLGGGKYFRAADSEQLSEIYDIIDREEKTEVKIKEYFHFRELYHFFLIPALVLLGLEMLLKTTLLGLFLLYAISPSNDTDNGTSPCMEIKGIRPSMRATLNLSPQFPLKTVACKRLGAEFTSGIAVSRCPVLYM